MAIPMKMIYTIRDRKNKTSTMCVYLKFDYPDIPAQLDLSNAITIAQHVAGLIDAMISGAIVNINLNQSVSLPVGIKTMATSTADVEEKAIFKFSGAFAESTITIPTFKDSLIIDGSDAVDQTDADVVAFIFDMIDGSLSPLDNYDISDSRDNPISRIDDAYERFSKSGKR